MKSEITYSILLFLIYRIVFYMTGISPNTAMYGLFVILLLFYYLTGNLNFNKKRRYNSLYVNALIFLIFMFFYKRIYVFVAFLMFSILQILLQRFFRKINIDEEERYNPTVINLRNGVKLLLDSGSVCAAILISFAVRYSVQWSVYLKKEYLIIYMSIFLLGYVYKKMSEKSWSYTNILDVLDLLCLNISTSIIFTIFMYKNNKQRNYLGMIE